jgi:penicillin-binding protein 1A
MSKKRKKSRSRFSKGKVQLYITGKKIRLYILYGIIGIVTLIFILFSCVYTGVFGHLPGESELKKIQNYLASEVYSADDKILGKYYIQNRTNINYSEVPEYFIDGLIATEDARFYKHNGIDKRSLLRVFFKTLLLQKESSGGGSTITQQLAKNLFPRRSYAFLTTPVNKFREMIIAVRLEKVYSKEEILEFYMNTVSFGENTYGIETASKRFFNKHPAELKIEEAALLIGMLKGTNIYNPKNQTESAIARRNIVLNQMVKYNYLAAGKADSIKKLPIKLNYTKLTHNEGIAPYFRETLRLELQEWCRKRVKSDGTRYHL